MIIFQKIQNIFKKKNKLIIKFISNNNLNLTDYIIEFQSKTKKTIEIIEQISELKKHKTENYIAKNIQNKKTNLRFKKKKFYKKKFYKKKIK